MKLCFTFIVATYFLLAGSTSTTPSTGPPEGASDCPSSLTYGGGTQKYRFVENVLDLAPPQYFPCIGDIPHCVFTAHHKFYCMNGYKPDYTPHELNVHYDQVTYKNVETYAGQFSPGPGAPNFTINTDSEPILSMELFPNEFSRRLVVGGFIMKTQGGGAPSTFPVGFNQQLPYAKPTHFYLSIGEAITEAFGRSGLFIDQVTFGVTPNPANPSNAEPPKFYSCGGFSTPGLFDATPPPHVNGPCSLQGLSGQTAESAGVPVYIRAFAFYWQCVGKPTSYNK